MTDSDAHLHATDYFVAAVDQATAKRLVEEYHYAKGGPNTGVFRHGLFRVDEPDRARGVAWWLPPTKPAAVSVAGEGWRGVLSLSRLVVAPEVPTNGASFLLGKSIKLIRGDARWTHLVTYADERQGHEGQIYRATNWEYVGAMRGAPVWLDEGGRQVATKATVNRTYAQMESLGYQRHEGGRKHKFTMSLRTSTTVERIAA